MLHELWNLYCGREYLSQKIMPIVVLMSQTFRIKNLMRQTTNRTAIAPLYMELFGGTFCLSPFSIHLAEFFVVLLEKRCSTISSCHVY